MNDLKVGITNDGLYQLRGPLFRRFLKSRGNTRRTEKLVHLDSMCFLLRFEHGNIIKLLVLLGMALFLSRFYRVPLLHELCASGFSPSQVAPPHTLN